MTREPWGRGFSIDSLPRACEFVDSLWADDRTPPNRIHERGVEPDSQLGSPRWSARFNRHLFASPHDTMTLRQGYTEGDHFIRTGPDRDYYRYPLWRAMTILERRDHDSWTKGVERRPFHPRPADVLRYMAMADFNPARVVLWYTDGTRVPDDMAELFCIGAARKLRGVYQEDVVEWTSKSDSQRKAEGEEAA